MNCRARVLIGLLFVSWMSDGRAEERKPNLVILFADDAGYADFGFQKQPAADAAKLTPRIDSIARNGATFTNGYVSGCVCSPSRAGLLTGRYQERFGHELNIPPGYLKGGMPLTEKTIADRLGSVGYSTALVGKWHLGYPAEYHPNRRGFDYFYGCLQGSRSYFPYAKPTPHRVIQENGKPTKEEGYVTDRLGQAAARYVTQNKDKPFFLFVSFTAPHGPLHAKEDDLKQLVHIKNERRRKYAAMVKSLDDNVGLILETLKKQGLWDNTLVVFLNDNGGQTLTGAVNTPLRGRKGTLWEGGTRVPFCLQWPGRIKAGQVIDDPVISLDLLPTFLAAGGGKPDPRWKLDGVNLLPRLTGEVESLSERPLFWRRSGRRGPIAVRLGNWKLLDERGRADAAPELYDLSKDVSETTDLAKDHPERVQKLSALLKTWESQLKDPLWGPRRSK